LLAEGKLGDATDVTSMLCRLEMPRGKNERGREEGGKKRGVLDLQDRSVVGVGVWLKAMDA